MGPRDGGPAFPVPMVKFQDGFTSVECAGMSLRDAFAMAAMQGDWGSQSDDLGYFSVSTPAAMLENRAALYYRMADAMLKARKLP